MKYLLVLAVVMVAFWLWRNGRRQDQAQAAQRRASARPARTPPSGVPQQMARCATCGLHLPQADALPGPGGNWYCSAEHQAPQARH